MSRPTDPPQFGCHRRQWLGQFQLATVQRHVAVAVVVEIPVPSGRQRHAVVAANHDPLSARFDFKHISTVFGGNPFQFETIGMLWQNPLDQAACGVHGTDRGRMLAVIRPFHSADRGCRAQRQQNPHQPTHRHVSAPRKRCDEPYFTGDSTLFLPQYYRIAPGCEIMVVEGFPVGGPSGYASGDWQLYLHVGDRRTG